MFCAECGYKNKKEDKFCAECGNPLKKEKKKERKPLTKKSKIMIAVGLTLCLLLVTLYTILSKITSPKYIAKSYFEAMTSPNIEEIYQYLEIEETPFTTKEIFKKKMEEQLKEEKIETKVKNSKVTEVNRKDLTASVKIKYIREGKTEEEETTIHLNKEKKKKYLFFDTWVVEDIGSVLIKDYEIFVLKGAEIELEGVKVDRKYLDKKESTNKIDVYKIPALFDVNYQAKIKLPMGITINTEIKVNRYNKSYKIEGKESDIEEKGREKIETDIIKELNTIYENAIKENDFDSIQNTFTDKKENLDELEKSYEKLKTERKKNTTKLDQINFSKGKIKKITLEEDGKLSINIMLNYDYKITYEEKEEQISKEGKSTWNAYLKLTYQEKTFKITEITNIKTYFSRY